MMKPTYGDHHGEKMELGGYFRGKMFEFGKKLYAYFFVHKNKQNSVGTLTSFGEINFFPKSGWPGLISFQHVHLKKEFQLNLSDLHSKFV